MRGELLILACQVSSVVGPLVVTVLVTAASLLASLPPIPLLLILLQLRQVCWQACVTGQCQVMCRFHRSRGCGDVGSE